MKKVLLIGLALVFAIATQAQDVRKQTGGEHNFEMMLAPLGSNPLSIAGIKYRKFTSATTAIRASVFLGFSTDKSQFNSYPDGTPAPGAISNDDGTETTFPTVTANEFEITIAPGVEKHFSGTDRLSPYTGAELVLGFMSSSEKYEQLNDDGDAFEDGVTVKDGSFSVGANVLGGADYYFANNIYLGGEFGFGVLFTTNFDTKVEPADGDEVTSGPNGNNLSIAPNFVGKIRVGWLFIKS